MRDGSRCFLALRPNADWETVRNHVPGLEGAKLTRFLTDGIAEAWIDFHYAGYKFNINDSPGDYWFFVSDPECPDSILHKVAEHFGSLLEPEGSKQGLPPNKSFERTREG
jgi:hypothetical protein